MKHIGVALDDELHLAFRKLCMESGLTIREGVVSLIALSVKKGMIPKNAVEPREER